MSIDEDSRAFWSQRRVLVTGGGGLLGSWLCRDLLGLGASVVGLGSGGRTIHPSFHVAGVGPKWVTGSLADFTCLQQALADHAIDTVFHLAALSTLEAGQSDPRLAFETNIQGCWNLLEACRQSGRIERVVLASSTRAYGATDSEHCTEEEQLRPGHPYEVSKACADLLGQSYYRHYGLPVTIARCGNFFGGGDLHFSRIVPGTVRAVLSGQPPVVHSDGQAVLEYSYVLDIMRACLLLAQKTPLPGVTGEVFNVSSGYRFSVLELIEKIVAAADLPALRPRVLNTAPGGGHCPGIVTNKARELLGWQPAYALGWALRETIDWYRQNPDSLPN